MLWLDLLGQLTSLHSSPCPEHGALSRLPACGSATPSSGPTAAKPPDPLPGRIPARAPPPAVHHSVSPGGSPTVATAACAPVPGSGRAAPPGKGLSRSPGILPEGARSAPRMPTGLCSYLGTAENLTNGLDHNRTECVAEARLVPLCTFTQQREKAHCSLLSPNVSLGEVQEKSLFEWDLQVILAEGLGLSLPYTERQDLQHR